MVPRNLRPARKKSTVCAANVLKVERPPQMPATISGLATLAPTNSTPASNEAEVVRQAKVAFNPADYTVSQVFYPSKDGTRVPMFVAHRKDLDVSKPHPTLLYAYGGFNISSTPGFSVSRLVWMEMGILFLLIQTQMQQEQTF